MKKILLASAIALLLSSTVQADTIGVYLGAQVVRSNATGLWGEQNNQIDFNLENKTQGRYFIAIEHPLPFIPNLKISTTKLDTQGATTLTKDFIFGNTTFTNSFASTSDIKAKYVDFTAYYEVFDNDLVSFDFGLTVRRFTTNINVSAQSNSIPPVTSSSTISASANVPMIYAATTIGLPFTGVDLFAEGNFLSFKNQSFYDYQAGVSYKVVDSLAADINLTLGYRSTKIQLDNLDKLYTDITFSGVFAGAVIHF